MLEIAKTTEGPFFSLDEHCTVKDHVTRGRVTMQKFRVSGDAQSGDPAAKMLSDMAWRRAKGDDAKVVLKIDGRMVSATWAPESDGPEFYGILSVNGGI